ncbi:hypothetical protein BJY27_007963 [Streptomyces rapamycinicus]|uniref:Uncharacterized protein n=1 Tax=Streptomyces rapamycinicus TaxID=1226757 RepID=A0ABR6LXD0_9ACTN|nr:hypothetical protein [Streptomyces rapamycinicus]
MAAVGRPDLADDRTLADGYARLVELRTERERVYAGGIP